MNPTFYAILGLKDEQFRKGLKGSQKELGTFQKSIKAIGPQMAAAFSAAAIVSFTKEAVAGFFEEERSLNQLTSSLNGNREAAERLMDQAEKMQGVTLFDDGDIKKSMMTLSLFVKGEKEIAQMMPLIADLAQAKNIDMAKASEIVGKALMGQTRGLKSVGIEMKYTGDKASMYAAVMKKLNDAVGGQAKAALGESEKGFRGIQVAIDEFSDTWGKMVSGTATGGFTRFLETLINDFTELVKYMDKSSTMLEMFVKWIGQGAIAGTIFRAAMQSLINWWNRNFKLQLPKWITNLSSWGNDEPATGGEMGPEPSAIPTNPDGSIKKTQEELDAEAKLQKEAQDKALKDYTDYTKKMQAVAEEEQTIQERTAEVIRNTIAGVGEDLEAGWQAASDAAARHEELYGTLAYKAEETRKAVEGLTNAYRDEAEVADELDTKGIADKFIAMAETTKLASEAMQQALQQLAQGVIDAFSQMIEAAVAGEKMDFGAAILSTIGGFMKTLGEAFISIGGLGKLFDTALKSMQWEIALAAGVALLAAGSVVSGLAKKGVEMAEGGVVPGGFPNDSYPALLTSGETVIPPKKLDTMLGGGVVVMETRVKGEDLYFIQKKMTSKHDRYS